MSDWRESLPPNHEWHRSIDTIGVWEKLFMALALAGWIAALGTAIYAKRLSQRADSLATQLDRSRP